MWYVYFLELSNGDICVGSTNDLRRRFKSHQAGQVSSTSGFLPANLKSYTALTDETTARKLELYFKSGSGKALAKKRFLTAPPRDEAHAPLSPEAPSGA
ncbi:MAG TPA: GIY-YIG nuclease family protein [Caulobacteraceae bacterium]|jgi:predicted GIY-YIG superfamily endonuclease